MAYENDTINYLRKKSDSNTWLAYQQNHWLSFSVRVQGLKQWNVRGADYELYPEMGPGSDVANTGGENASVFFGQ